MGGGLCGAGAGGAVPDLAGCRRSCRRGASAALAATGTDRRDLPEPEDGVLGGRRPVRSQPVACRTAGGPYAGAGIAESMAEFVCMATLMLHHDVAAYIDQRPRRCRGTDRATAPPWQTPATSLRKGQVYSGAARTSRAALQSRAVPSRAEPIEAAKTAILAAAKSAGAPKACPAMKSDMVKPIPASALAPAS